VATVETARSCHTPVEVVADAIHKKVCFCPQMVCLQL
jgi:hypothetical protein